MRGTYWVRRLLSTERLIQATDVFEASAALNVGPVRRMALDFIAEHFTAVGK